MPRARLLVSLLAAGTLACSPEPRAGVATKPAVSPQTAPEQGSSPLPTGSAQAGATTSGAAATAEGEGAGAAEVGAEGAPPSGVVIPDEPHRVLIVGDSLAATGFGVLLQKKLDAHPHVECHRKAKSATGLARPDFFDWMHEAKQQVELRKPQLVIVVIGGNDGQDLTPKSKGGKRVQWGSPEWTDAYRERLIAFLQVVSGNDRKVLWLGLPRMGMQSFERKLELIRATQQEAIAKHGNLATYLDTIPLWTNAAGDLLEEATVGTKKRAQRLREDDGIHFTMAGSQYFADEVYPAVLEVLRLPSDEALAAAKASDVNAAAAAPADGETSEDPLAKQSDPTGKQAAPTAGAKQTVPNPNVQRVPVAPQPK